MASILEETPKRPPAQEGQDETNSSQSKFQYKSQTNIEQNQQTSIFPQRRFPQRTRSEAPVNEDISAIACKVLNQTPTDTSPKYYYLLENLKKLENPQFIRQNTNVQYTNDFSNQIIEVCFEEYYNLLKSNDPTTNESAEGLPNFSDFLFDNHKEILEKYPDFRDVKIEWMTISNAKVNFDHVSVQCKLQLTAKSELKASFSMFTPQDLTKTESAIEVFANSEAEFTNCYFSKAGRVSVIARNYSTVKFKNCIFDDNKISCFIMDDSCAIFENCIFTNDQNISVFVTKDSKAQLEGCIFCGIAGKAIFAKDSSNVYITNTSFLECTKGAATIAEGSSLFLDCNILISNPNNTAIRAIGNSHIKAKGVEIRNTNGNAINIDNSEGYFVDCNISNTIHPTIAVIGRKANPIFHNCNLTQNNSTFCVICKNCCRPLFNNCNFENCKTNCFSVSDFSRPHIQNCTFKDIEKFYINIFGGSKVTYDNLISQDGIDLSQKIHIAPRASCEAKDIMQVEIDFEREKQGIDASENQDDCEGARVRSWKSPTYKPTPTINEIKDPEIIKDGNLKQLQLVIIALIVKEFDGDDIQVQFVCSSCHKVIDEENEEPQILCPCGHAIHECCKNVEKCPICDSPVREVKKVYKEKLCTICYDNVSNTLSMPCAHLCMCYGCASKCAEKNYNCPMCNESLSSYKYLFSDTKIQP